MIVTPPRTTQLAYVLTLVGAVLSSLPVAFVLVLGVTGAAGSLVDGVDDADVGGGTQWLGLLGLLGLLAVGTVAVWVAFRIRSGHVAGLVGGLVLGTLGLAQSIAEAAVSDRFRPSVVVWSVVQAAVLWCLVSPSNRSYVRAMTALRTTAATAARATAPRPPGSPPAP